MRRKERAATIDDGLAIGFKSIGRVVESNVKEQAQKTIGQTVNPELHRRIIDNAAALDKAAPKDAVITFGELFPVAHHIPTIIGFIRHHDDHGIAANLVQAKNDGATKATFANILHWAQGGKV